MATSLTIILMGDQEEAIVVATIGVTIVILILGDSTPKTIGAHNAERLSKLYARPIEWFSWLFTPFVWVLSWIASVFTKIAGGKPVPRSLATEEEIRTMITVGEREGAVEEEEAEMLHNIFEFTDRQVREVMMPRPNVIFIESGIKIGDFLVIYAQSPLSRYPVFKERRDNVIGVLGIKDVLMAFSKGTTNIEASVDEFVRPAYFAPTTKHIGELFQEMREKNYHLCVVVDEFGGTAGIVTLNRLVEEIVGPVGDELAPSEKDFEVIDTHTFEIDGGMRIEEVNEQMSLELPEGDYETVAGFILSLLGRIPKENEQLRYRDLKLIIKEMNGIKIEKVLLTKEDNAAITR
jgi:putative hemolysin